MSVIITSYFSAGNAPQLNLTPTIRIWEVDGATQTLIVGAPNGTGSVTDGVMTEVDDGTSADGFYQFEFTTANGHDPSKHYAYRVDGGATAVQRYQSGVSNPSDCLDTLVDAVWDEPANDHLVAGSFGEKLNQNNAAAQTLIMAMSDVQNLVRLLLKYETNRTRIDHVAKTLTVYDDDGTTILRVFNLLDGNGVGSVDEVCERTPTSATDGLPVLP